MAHQNRFEQRNDTRLSKNLSWLLRHGAITEGISIDLNGYVKINDILGHSTFKNYNADDIRRVVANDKKNRYKYFENKIKANQGHSMEAVINSDLKRITNPDLIPIAIHGTYKKYWNQIKTDGLKRFTRNHIHFTNTDQPKLLTNEKISGFRESAEILIYLNTKKVLESGMDIYLSDNNVILCSGINGVISPEYFGKVIDRKSKYLLYSN